jgi:shikimate kinase
MGLEEEVSDICQFLIDKKDEWNENPLNLVERLEDRRAFTYVHFGGTKILDFLRKFYNCLANIDPELENALKAFTKKNDSETLLGALSKAVNKPETDKDRIKRIMTGVIDYFNFWCLGKAQSSSTIDDCFRGYMRRLELPFITQSRLAEIPRPKQFNEWLEFAIGVFGCKEWEKYKIDEKEVKELKLEMLGDGLGIIGPSLKYQKFDLKWDDVIGLDQAKRKIIETFLLPEVNPELANYLLRAPSEGMVMIGPGGTGKTLLAKVVASELDATFIEVKEVDSMWKGEAERNIKLVFNAARQKLKETEKPVILYISEIDRILGGSDCQRYSQSIRSTFKSEINATESNSYRTKDGKEVKLYIMGDTNQEDLPQSDEALFRPGRLLTIKVEKPNKEELAKIWELYLKNYKKDPDINYQRLVELTANMTGADIAIGILADTLPGLICKKLLNGKPLDQNTVKALRGINPKTDERVMLDQNILEDAIKVYNQKKQTSPAPKVMYQ